MPTNSPKRPVRLVFICGLVYFIFVSVFTVWDSQREQERLYHEIDGRLTTAALSLKHMLAVDFHDRTTSADSISFEEEMENRRRFNRFARETGMTYVYMVVEQGGKYYFSAPTVTPEEAAEIQRWYFYPYENPPKEFVRAMSGGETVAVSYEDEWGTFRSVAVPERSPGGRRYLACADLDISRLDALVWNKRMESVFLGTLFLVFCAPIIFSFRVLYKRYNDELEMVNAKLRDHRDHLETKVEERTEELLHAKEAAEEAEQAKTRFLAVMSHEIRTPLNTILGMADVLDGTGLSSGQKERLRDMRDAGEHLLMLISDILDFSRLDSGQWDMAKEPFLLSGIINGAVMVASGQYKRSSDKVTFVLDVESEVKPCRLGDPTRLRQILVNLLTNAFKFTDEGEVSLTVRNHGSDSLLFVVRDSGVGIAPESLNKIFDSFTQGDATAMREYGGTGLGLAIASRLVEGMGGEITAERLPEGGSEFRFTARLPVTELRNGAGTQPPVPDEALPPLRILAAEDYTPNYKLVEYFLSETPAMLERAQDGQEAVDMAAQGGYGLILMDLQMPRKDGLSAVREIRSRERREGAMPVPILALTADAQVTTRADALAAGCDGVLTKPLTKQTLFTEIMKYFPSIDRT